MVEYNAKALPTKVTDPLGRETRLTYGTGSTPDPDPATGTGIDLLKVEQKNGAAYDLLQSYTYNAQHEVLTSTDAAGQTTTYTYFPNGQLQTVVTPPRNGHQPGEPTPRPLTLAERTTTYSYYPDNAPTGAGRIQTVTGPSMPQGSPVTSYTYDGYGRRRTLTDPDNYTLTYDYDALDRGTKVTYPDGTTEDTVYNRLDSEGRKDRLGRWSQTFHDALRRVVATRDAAGRTTTYQWCTCGSLDKVIDANNNATTFERDLQGRVTREIRADGKDRLLIYETTTSRIKQKQDFMSPRQVKAYEYFLDGSLKQVTYTNALHATSNVSFTYDPVYYRVLTMTDGTGMTTYNYNPVSTPPSLGAGEAGSVDGPLSNDTVSYTYDELGQIASRGLAGAATSFAFDALGRVTRLTHPIGTFAHGYVGTSSRVSGITYPNGQTTARTYFGNTGDNRLQQIQHATASSAVLTQFDYTYDAVGNVKSWRQQRGANPAKLYTLSYDAVNGLASGVVSGPNPLPVPSRFAYAYDKVGNRTAEQLDDAVVGATYNNWNQVASRQPGGAQLFRGAVSEPATVTVSSNPAQVAADNSFIGQAQVPSGTGNVVVTATDPSGNTRTNTYQVTQSGSSAAYTYDANGNLTGDGTRTFEWDAENRLTRVLNGGNEVARFVYDGQGRRVQKIAGGITTTFVYDMDDVAEERSSTGAVLKYVRGPGSDQHLAMQDGAGVTSYYLADHLGSVVQMTNAAAQVTLSREYDPYGNPLAGAAQGGYAFTGREWDPETQLYSYRARYYSASLGSFISEDSVDYKDGLSRYAYVMGRPTSLVDPTGHIACPPDCTPAVKQGARDACNFAHTIPDAKVRRCMKDKCPDISLDCRGPSVMPCSVPGIGPAYSGPLTEADYSIPANTIMVCTNAPLPKGSCYKRIFIHELYDHFCRPEGPAYPKTPAGHAEHDKRRLYIKSITACP